jgi:hypothetical protein
MNIYTERERLALDAKIEPLLGGSLAIGTCNAQLLRKSLSVLPPHQLVGLWFGRGTRDIPPECFDILMVACREVLSSGVEEPGIEAGTSLETAQDYLQNFFGALLRTYVDKARRLVDRRSLLFAWVYGPSPAVRALAHVRLPCRERRLLVDLLLIGLRRRYPWLMNRHVCAMAFRQHAFTHSHTVPEGLLAWGPLYGRVVIQQGKKSRHLWVPNPVLRNVQKSLLRVLQPVADHSLGGHVFGARLGLVGPTFLNASMHLHRSIIASFDIKDFFPSTSVADIIRGLQHIAARDPPAVDPVHSCLYPDFLRHGSRLKLIRWTDQLRVFVSRLGTHRGRLPQGSPISPLLANIAFSPYDDRILALLEQEFGRGRVTYTRYFDDMTISALPPQGAGSRMTPASFRKRCEAILVKVLAASSYVLNARKTRVSVASDGHLVTGVTVRRSTLHLPRAQRRHIRTVLHTLRHHDFVHTASRWRQLAGRPNIRFVSIRQGHRFAEGRLTKRRMSAERLATLMLRHLYPDLKLRRLLSDWHPWQETVESSHDCVTGKRMWPLIEWLLAASWTGVVQPHRPYDDAGKTIMNRIILRQRDNDVCVVEAESSLDFFFLSRDHAVATSEYWHYLQGFTAHLSSCPQGEPFSPIRRLAELLKDAVATIEIRAAPGDKDVRPEIGINLPVTTSEHFDSITTECDRWLRDHLHVQQAVPERILGDSRDTFRRMRADTWASFLRWIQAANALTTELCPTLPTCLVADSHIEPQILFEYLQWRSAIDKGLAADNYNCVKEFQERMRIGPNTSSTHLKRVQCRIVESLLAYFRAAYAGPQPGSLDRTRPNPWHGEIANRLRDQLNVFEEFHFKARTASDVRRLFRTDTWQEVTALRDTVLDDCNTQLPSTQVWAGLERTAKNIYVALVEAMEHGVCTNEPPDKECSPEAWRRRHLWKQSQSLVDNTTTLKLIDALRNREAHGRSPERRPEWVGIQNKVASILGRSWKSRSGQRHPNYAAPDDLSLTRYEGHVVTMNILLAVNHWLQRIVELQWWQVVGGR